MHCTLFEAALSSGSNAACPDSRAAFYSTRHHSCLPYHVCVPAASQPAASTTAVSSSPGTLLDGGNPIDLKGDFFLCARTDLNNSRWAGMQTGGSCWQLNWYCCVPCEVHLMLAQETAAQQLLVTHVWPDPCLKRCRLVLHHPRLASVPFNPLLKNCHGPCAASDSIQAALPTWACGTKC